MLKPECYLMRNPVQNYAWGARGVDAFIPKLLEINPEKELPYAELWMGAHPKAASEIEFEGKWVNLDFLIRKFPNEFLGNKVVSKFGSKLPFLFKVLSASEPLSIQMHPNLEQAKKLNAIDPLNYPDENHKPEIAIAIDYLKALVGFKPIEEIIGVINSYVGFEEVKHEQPIRQLIDDSEIDQSIKLKDAFSYLIRLASNQPVRFNKIIFQNISQISSKKTKTEVEDLFFSMYEKYGNDIGLISILFFNYVILKPGEAIYTPAGIPHAYIEGNIIECMANSDNVIRAGLTPKFTDVENLLNLINYEQGNVSKVNTLNTEGGYYYETPDEEFRVTHYELRKGEKVKFLSESCHILLILKGQVTINNLGEQLNYSKGDVIFLPAILKEVEIISQTESKLYVASVNVG
jgi:mannose-6-phosphate isomerase